MKNINKTKKQLLIEIEDLKSEISNLEKNITRGKKVQEKVKKTENQVKELNTIISHSPSIAFLWKNKSDWPIEYVSENVKHLTGYTKQEFLSEKIKYTDLIHLDDLKKVTEEVEVYEANEKLNSFKHKPYRIITKNKEVKWINDETVIRRDEQGEVTHYEGVVYDISDKKNAEDAMKESESKFKAFTNQSIDGITVADLEGNYTYVNPAFCAMSGFSEAELLEMTVFDMKAKNQSHESFYQSKGNMEGIPIPVNLKRKDGTEYLTEIIGNTININEKKFILGTIRDITERVKAEKKLRTSELNLIKAQEISQIGSWEINKETLEMNCSKELLKIYDIDAVKPTLNDFINVIHPDDLEYTQTHGKNGIENGVNYDIEHRLLLKGGSVKWVHVIGESIENSKKDDVYLSGIAQDITKQKQDEELLQESQEKYKALYQNAPLSYQSLSEDGCFIDINPTWLNTLGYVRDEVIGKPYIDFLYPDYKIHFKKNFPAFKKRGYVKDVQFKIQHKKGHFLDISFEGCIGYYPDGSFKQTYCVFKDITAQIKSEELLKKSEEKFKSLSKNTPNFILTINKNGEIQYMNRVLEGVKLDEIIGTNIYLYIDSDYHKLVKECVKSVFETGKSTQYETRGLGLNGNTADYLSNIGAIFDDKGEVELAIISTQDITERKKQQEQLNKSESQYRLLVEQSPVAIQIFEPTGEVVIVNSAFQKLWDVSEETIQDGNEKYNIFKDLQLNKLGMIPYIKKAFSGETIEFPIIEYSAATFSKELDIENQEGRSRWIKPHIFPLKNEKDEVISITMILEDLSDQKNAEIGILKEKQILKNVIDNIPVMITHYDPEAKMLYLNSEFETKVGWKTDEVQDIDMMEKVYPDPAYRKEALEYMQLATNEWREFKVQSKSGEIIDSEWSNITLKDGSQIGIGLDIRDRKKTEEELKNYREHLKELVSERTKELHKKNKELDKAVKVFVGRELKIRALEKKIKTLKAKK